MRSSRGMGIINPSKMPRARVKRRRDNTDFTQYAEGGKVSKVNEAGNYTKPTMRKSLFNQIKNAAVQGIDVCLNVDADSNETEKSPYYANGYSRATMKRNWSKCRINSRSKSKHSR